MDFQPPECPMGNISPHIDSSIAGSSLERSGQMRREIERRAEGRALLNQLQSLDRGAFRDQLIAVLMAAPSVEAVARYAERAPDRYYQALAIVARLAGYSERPEDGASHAGVFAQIHTLSDSELAARLRSMDQKLSALLGREPAGEPVVVDGEIVSSEATIVAPEAIIDDLIG